MKKSVFILAGTLALSISCTKEIIETQQTGSVMLNAEAAAPPQTKVAYSEDAAGNYQGKWEEGDIIFGFKADGTTFDFVVESVSAENGNASLRQQGTATFSAGDEIYAIYMPGKTSADLSGNTLPVDFSKQAEDELPVLMVATATVTAGPSVKFSFENAASIVAVVNPAIPGEASDGKKVVKMTLSGHEIVSAGTVQVSGGKLGFVGNAPCNFIEKSVNAPVTASGEGYTLENPVLIVVPAGKVDKLSVLDNKNGFSEYKIGQSAVAGKYYRIAGKTFTAVSLPQGSSIVAGGVEWSRWNLGTTTPTGAGDLYRWSDTGLIYTSKTSSSITWDDNHKKGFVEVIGEIYCTAEETYSKYTEPGYYLEPVDDIVQLTYPGTGWRMSRSEEFTALANLKKNTADYTVSLNDNGNVGIKYTRNSDQASVFLRGNHPCSKGGTTTAINLGRYWTANTRTSEAGLYTGQYFKITISDKLATGATGIGTQRRHFGYAIRPVKPVATEE